MIRRLDFLSQPPQIYIFQQNSNKTSFGGVIFTVFIFFMIFISLLYIYNFILNEKFEIEYLKYYSPITEEKREFLNSDPELNPQFSFFFDGSYYIKNNYSSNFAFYDKTSDKYYEGINFINITQNVSSFQIELLYKCQNIDDDVCSLRDKDKNISYFQNYFGFDFTYPSFILDHSKPDPFELGHNISSNYLFSYNNPVSYSLFWKVIKYKNEKSLFQFLDSWRGKKNEYTEGYIDKGDISPIPPTYRNRRTGIFSMARYKVIGRIKLFNLHIEYEEYKRKDVKFLTILADICALFTSIKGLISSIFTTLYSNSFDNHKMVKKILLKKIKKKDEKLELFPLNNVKDNSNLKNNLIDKKTDTEDYEQEIFNLDRISWIRYLLNNIYFPICGCNIQDRIKSCNEIIQQYMSYECILYNQLMFEQLLMDYRWNDNSLKNLANNNLIVKLKNLELGIS